jgi:hypothetical protein
MALVRSVPVNGEMVFEFKTEAEARGTFACDAKSALKALERWNCDRAVVRIAGQPELTIPIATLRLMAEATPIVQLFFADTSLPTSVLKVATIKAEESSRWGIVRMSDERQIVMSSGMSGILLSGVSIDQTTQWKRPEFWNLEHLNEFNQTWQHELREDSSNAIEYRYQIRKPNTRDPWEWYRSSYRLMRGEDGLLYQICTFLDKG